MSCLRVSDIYAYLEGDLSPAERGVTERHLGSCPRCREAVEERKVFSAAASSLPDLDVPAHFRERVMAKIVPVRRRLPVWLIAFAAGLASLILLLGIVVIFGNKNVLAVLGTLDHTFWGYAKNAAVFITKVATLISFAGKALSALSQALNRGVGFLAALISPGVQIFIITFSLVLLGALFYVLGKKFRMGEKT
jgi:predicted anti-sigma-YlaC factor YlaD